MCIINRAIPRTRHTQPTTMYAIPRKGFLPPSSDVVLRIILFVPSKADTWYAEKNNCLFQASYSSCWYNYLYAGLMGSMYIDKIGKIDRINIYRWNRDISIMPTEQTQTHSNWHRDDNNRAASPCWTVAECCWFFDTVSWKSAAPRCASRQLDPRSERRCCSRPRDQVATRAWSNSSVSQNSWTAPQDSFPADCGTLCFCPTAKRSRF